MESAGHSTVQGASIDRPFRYKTKPWQMIMRSPSPVRHTDSFYRRGVTANRWVNSISYSILTCVLSQGYWLWIDRSPQGQGSVRHDTADDSHINQTSPEQVEMRPDPQCEQKAFGDEIPGGSTYFGFYSSAPVYFFLNLKSNTLEWLLPNIWPSTNCNTFPCTLCNPESQWLIHATEY